MKIIEKYLSFFIKKDFNEKDKMNLKDFGNILVMKIFFAAFAIILIKLSYLLYKEVLVVPSEEYSKPLLEIYFSAVILAPFIEELIFRLPLLIISIIFSRWTWIVMLSFFILSLTFGMIHITNYTNIDQLNIFQIIMQTLPQIFGGFILGWVCLKYKFGLMWCILLHGAYNFSVITLALIF